MKCSPIRKRYVAIQCQNETEGYRISGELKRVFRAKLKFKDSGYIIVLTDQFLKEQLCRFVENQSNGYRIIGVSGTVRGCKTKLGNLREKYLEIPKF